MKKLNFTFSLLALLNINAQTINDYQQKLSECFRKDGFKYIEENVLASIAIFLMTAKTNLYTKGKYILMGKLCLFIIFILHLTACEEITHYYESPSIQLKSVTQKSLSSFEVSMEVYKGEGQILQYVELELQDLTILDSPIIIKQIQLNDDNIQKINYVFEDKTLNHDYSVKAILVTNLYEYVSEPVIYRAVKNNFFLEIIDDETYHYLAPELGMQTNGGESFIVYVHFVNLYDGDVKIKLNKAIECTHNIDLSYGSDENGHLISSGNVNVPKTIEPGDYEVYLYVQGLEIKANKKIRILEGSWDIFNTNYPGEKMGNYAWFKIDKKLYVVGGHYNSASILKSPVWCLDLETGDWQQKNDFPWGEGDLYYCKIFDNEMGYNNEGYISVRDKDQNIQIWKYLSNEDDWEKLADYPGEGKSLLTSFNISSKVYIGGGIIITPSGYKPATDFWSFDIDKGNWERLDDLPMKPFDNYYIEPVTCSSTNKAYLFQFPEKLWEFDPLYKSWTVKAKFPGPFRETARMLIHDENVYVLAGFRSYIGNQSYKDCWQFSPAENKWKMISFLPHYTNYGICTSYNNNIIMGLGYAHQSYQYYDEPILYKFSM